MKAIVLAAGKGSRLQSEKYDLPKVLRTVKNRALLDYVLENVNFIPKEDTTLVVGYKREMVEQAVSKEYRIAVQEEQLGTGHAVASATEVLKGYDGDVLILYGDMPMLRRETYENLIKRHHDTGAKCTILTTVTEAPLAYGRIIRENDKIVGIVEQKDCTPEQFDIRERNVGVYVFDSRLLFENLKKLKNDNAQGEYYLTDVPKLLIADGQKVDAHIIGDTCEIYGVNTEEDLAFCENYL